MTRLLLVGRHGIGSINEFVARRPWVVNGSECKRCWKCHISADSRSNRRQNLGKARATCRQEKPPAFTRASFPICVEHFSFTLIHRVDIEHSGCPQIRSPLKQKNGFVNTAFTLRQHHICGISQHAASKARPGLPTHT